MSGNDPPGDGHDNTDHRPHDWRNFVPAPPPGTHGVPVFPNVDLSSIQHQHQHQHQQSLPDDDDDTTAQLKRQSTLRNQEERAVFCVTGAARGIGLELTRQLLQRTRGRVVALCRQPSPELQRLVDDEMKKNDDTAAADHRRLAIVSGLELRDQASVERVGRQLQASYDRIDALWNVAGLLGDKTTPGPERALRQLDRDWLEQSLAVNVIGPILLTKELAPLLQQRTARRKRTTSRQPPTKDDNNDNTDPQEQRPASVVVNLSARVGSISDNELGGWYSYRLSKAALNQATRTLAIELARNGHHNKTNAGWAIALHPGTTNTDLSAPFRANVPENSLFPVEFTVHQLLNVVDGLEEKHSGGFYDWAGQSLSF